MTTIDTTIGTSLPPRLLRELDALLSTATLEVARDWCEDHAPAGWPGAPVAFLEGFAAWRLSDEAAALLLAGEEALLPDDNPSTTRHHATTNGRRPSRR
jgi:hypothetical protein